MNQAISDLFQLELPQLEACLARLLGDIMPPDEAARAACKARWDAVGKPLGSLGLLETDTQKIAALTGSGKLTKKDCEEIEKMLADMKGAD